MFWTTSDYSPAESDERKETFDTSSLLHGAEPQDEALSVSKRRTSARQSVVSHTKTLITFISGLLIGVTLAALLAFIFYYARTWPSRSSDRVDRWSVARQDVLFMNDSKYVNAEAFTSRDRTAQALHEWVQLSSKDRGVVKIRPEESDGIPGPIVYSRDGKGPQAVYFTSAFHQLHCLSSIMQAYAWLHQGDDNTKRHGSSLSHLAHCFDYLRQGILCAGDTTLEGRTYDSNGAEVPIGWGSSHECKDWEQINAWADARQPWDGPYYPDFL